MAGEGPPCTTSFGARGNVVEPDPGLHRGRLCVGMTHSGVVRKCYFRAMTSVNTRALGGLLIVLIIMGALLFIAAGTFDYWQAWTLLTVFGISNLALTVYLMKHDPKLLERRVYGGPTAEKETSQKIIMSIMSLGFVAILAVSALDHRLHWSTLPPYVAIAGDMLVSLGWMIIFFVFKENSFTSSTIELAADQKVISTGPYALVRHPMYSGALIYLVGIPVALGSWWGLSVVLLMMPGLVWRIFDEERFLRQRLSGYAEYTDRVQHRLMPFIW
jgi:protein-S-isoprenylcysteine O-methyltransferase Ste14